MRILFSIFLLLLTSNSNASHYMGGEITWRTDSLHRFIFEVKFYRDCNGINAPISITLASNAVTGGIVCNLFAVNDLSPVGDPSCPTCQNPNGWQNAVEEFIFRSGPVSLPTSIPATGFYFEFTDCCRNALTNLSSTGSGNFTVRSLMFADNPGNTISGTDDSPQFLLSPSLGVCPGDYIEFSHAAYDPELDSLSFEWAKPLDGFYSNSYPLAPPAYPFASGYSYTNPLPDTSFNLLNIPASIDAGRGLITFRSYSPGAYLTVIKVTSFKNGIKTAEIYREIQVTVATHCMMPVPGFPNQTNQSPELEISKAGIPTYDDTVFIGESVVYNITATEFNIDSSGLQQFELTAHSPHFGIGYSDTLNGCLVPPCATLNHGPISGVIFLADTMHFTAACAHASYIDGVLQHQRFYSFTFKAKDDFCPVNSVRFKTLNIIVSGPKAMVSGNDLYIPNAAGSSIQWYLNGVLIPGATDTIINATAPGIYSAISTMPGGCALVTNAVNRSSTGIENIDKKVLNVYADQSRNLQVVMNSTSSMQNRIDIYALNGQLIKSFSLQLKQGPQHFSLQTQELNSGIYILKMGDNAVRFILP